MKLQKTSSNQDNNNHVQYFKHIFHINDTELSKYLWTLRANRTDYNLKWSIKSYVSRYKCGKKRCDLCLKEKMIIALAEQKLFIEQKN